MADHGPASRLRQAIALNDLSLVQRILKVNPEYLHNPNFEDKSNTSLHLAASDGHLEIVKFLITLGHDAKPPVVDDIYSNAGDNQGVSVNTDGRTALHLAATSSHTDVVRLLCESFPATINRSDNKGHTPLLLASSAQSKSITPPSGLPVVKTAIRAGEDTSTIETLLEHGADVRIRDHMGNTCLHCACAWGNLKAIRVIIQAGADPMSSNNAGWRPEHYSLTVQADIYYRNIVAEYEKLKAEEKRLTTERIIKNSGGVRLVQDDEDSDDNDTFSLARSRADSARSDMTTESMYY